MAARQPPAARARQRARRRRRRGRSATRASALPATGPSFRDATRVAGAQRRDLDRHLPGQPRRRSSTRIDDDGRAPAGRCARRCAAARRATAVGGLERRTPRERPPAAARGASWRAAPCTSCACRSPTGRASSREIALELGRGGRQHHRHGAATRPPTCATGVVALWIAGDDAAARAEALVARARLPGGAAREAASASSRRRAARRARPAAGQVDLAPRGAARRRCTPSPCTIHNYLDAGDTNSTLGGPARARRARRGSARRRARRSAAAGCAALEPPTEPIDVGNAGTLMRLLPGWLAGQEGGTLDARRRRVDPPPARRPHRRAAAA